ncbi:8557_t:CDS:10 [Diversispora eburnea]|uniref:8557_t:CDS:1 n=1 Tax=Diversispora eburnea TaxID=1213867 RepID=A0A9N9A615_9GLOM|nr:8557_t:CDS:10 [Diversispora eburnea]
MNADTRLMLTLINRIGAKLPCNSGKKLEVLELDPLLLQTVNAIVDLSRYRLEAIVNNFVPYEVLQSQLFILKILSACMTHHWKCYRGTQKKMEMSKVKSFEDFSATSPSNEKLADYILRVLAKFLHQMACQEDISSHLYGGPERPYPNGNSQVQFNAANYDIICEIYKNAGRVIFYISASNWDIVFNRIRQKIAFLCNTNEEYPETSELKLLEVSDLNSQRLSMVLQELCNTFMQLKKSAQITMATVLRKAIWNWIEVFPAEFVALCQSKKRMDGNPDLLFNICYNSTDNSARRKVAFWPLQTMLLILCPGILANAIKEPQTSRPTNRVQFLDSLKRSLKGKSFADVAAICYVDICKASTYVAKNENLALRMIVPEIENELTEKLFDPSKPFPNENHIDQQLMIDCLVALFRLNPKKTLHSLVPICLQENAPGIFKLVLVKSCNAIASEENRLPWNPRISSMHSMLASPLRKLFNDLMVVRRSNEGHKRKKMENFEIILNLLKLYRTDPKLVIVGDDKNEPTKGNQMIITVVTECLNDSDIYIRSYAAETLAELHNIDLIEMWGTPLQNFWLISSQITLAIAKQILDSNDTKNMLELLLQLLSRRNEFLRTHKVMDFHILFLALLTTENLANDMEETSELPTPSHMTIVENMNVYKELSTSGSVVAGKMAQQRRIRKLLRSMVQPTPGNLSAWEEAWYRWKKLTFIITRSSDESTTEPPTIRRGAFPFIPPHKQPQQTSVNGLTDAQSTEWNYYTRFLAALGGCCVHDRFRNMSGVESNSRRISTLHTNDYHSMVEKYVQEMVDLLVCETQYVRENVKETLGNELSPRLYVILFHHLESIVSRFFNPDGDANPNERYTLFVDQAISVLKLILERIYDSSDNLYACNIGGLVLSFARYLNKLGSGHNALKIKKRMCRLAELLMTKKDFVNLRQEIKLRNLLLEIIIEWNSEYNKTEHHGSVESVSNKSERLHRDLDAACLKTIVELLAQLPLQPTETTHDLSQDKSKMFYKYFSFFIRLLNRCRILEAIDSGTHSAKNNQDLQMLLSKSKEYVKDLGPLKDYTISALSNLLSANVDSGLKFSLSMGYHEDTKTRTAFMQVLRNILHQGIEFDGLSENAMKDRYERLVEIIATSDIDISLSLCEVHNPADEDEVARVLIAVFDSHNKAIDLLRALFSKEIRVFANGEEPNLFRRTSMTTKLLSVFAKAHGSEYLRETLQPVVNDLISKPSDFSCVIDPDRLTPGENIDQNLENLKLVTNNFLDAIFNSADNMPRTFKLLCHYSAQVVKEKNPDMVETTVGAFIFLRFFSPAITTPDHENLCKPIENFKTRQNFLMVARIIQRLANSASTNEPYMDSMKDFVRENKNKLKEFLNEISVAPISTPSSELKSAEATPTSRLLEDADRKSLHRLLYIYHENMSRSLQTRRLKSNLPGNTDNEQVKANKLAWDRISTLLAQLGPPSETPKKEFLSTTSHSFVNNNHLYLEFMRRNANRMTENHNILKDIFYEGGNSKANRPVFYYIAHRLQSEATDMDLLMYHILHTLEPCMGGPFEIMVDLTQFGPSNDIQSQWVEQFMRILPFEVVENLSKLYFCNTNTAFKRSIKKWPRPLPHIIAKRTVFCCTLSELYEYIAPSDVRLPKITMMLDTDNTSTTFTNVSRISHYRMQINVNMKISNEYLQIITSKKQEIFNGLSCCLNDVYHISEIEDVNNSSHKSDDNEFIIKQDRGKPPFAFTSNKRDTIIRTIRASKARYQITRPTNLTEKVIRPNGVPGTLLNMALLNIGSDDPNLRLAAYNLLVALSLIFNFDVGNQLLSAKENNSTFVSQMSEKLAISETHLTLEFLSEFFDGFYKSSLAQKHLCLQYMAPWLANLSFYCRDFSENQNSVKQTREIIRKLIDMTTKETEMYTSIQAKVWNTLKGVDEITNLIIDEFINYAVEHGISSTQAETVANTIVTLSSVNIRGKIITRLRKTKNLTENPAWTEIALFHVISLLVATGPPLIRASVHGLIVNLVQSLCTAQQLAPENHKRLTILLMELSEPNFHFFFGLNQSSGNAFVITAESTHNLPDTMPLSSLETVIQALLEVIICGAPSVDISNAWRARWMGLVASTAFQHNPAIQPRAFVALGCLAREEVDDDLLYQILVALKGALAEFFENDCSLIISIVMCLTKIVENINKSSQYLKELFWIAISLIQIGHIPIFPSAVNLLHVVLKSLDSNNFFTQDSISKVLLKFRRRKLYEIGQEMDKENGINFEHFSFAVAAALLKGLKNSATKSSTVSVLKYFLEISFKCCLETKQKNIVHSSMLGYLAACLPISAKTGEMKDILLLCGILDPEMENVELSTTYCPIINKLDIPDNKTALLLISLMVTLLQNAETETEKLFLYGFLAEAAKTVPDVFALVYDVLQPKMIQIVSNSDTIPILDAVHKILITVVSESQFSSRMRGDQISYLEEIGFRHLMDAGSFQSITKEKMKINAKLASKLVGRTIGH